MPDVKVKNLTKKFGKVIAVDDVSFVAEDKKFTTILGPSGCGKTTTLRVIAGFETPDEGESWIGDKLITNKKFMMPPEKRNIGMVFQSYAIWPHMNLFENVAFPLKIRKLPKEEIENKVKKTLELVKLEGFEKRYPDQISGGQQQRVALARALVYDPNILLLDEPLANLDVKLREVMRFELKELQLKTGVTTIYVTHDQTEAMALSDKIIVMKDGKIIQEGNPYEIYRNPADGFVADFIGMSNLIPAKIINTGYNGLVETEEGNEIYCKVPLNLKKNQKVLLCIRPETIDIYKKPLSSRNVWKAKIEKSIFLGNVIEHQVRTKGMFLSIVEKSHFNLPPGKIIYIGINKDCINVMPLK